MMANIANGNSCLSWMKPPKQKIEPVQCLSNNLKRLKQRSLSRKVAEFAMGERQWPI
jgi:hypothetical protein